MILSCFLHKSTSECLFDISYYVRRNAKLILNVLHFASKIRSTFSILPSYFSISNLIDSQTWRCFFISFFEKIVLSCFLQMKKWYRPIKVLEILFLYTTSTKNFFTKIFDAIWWRNHNYLQYLPFSSDDSCRLIK